MHHTCTIEGPLLHHTGTIEGPLLHHTGTIEGPLLHHTCTIEAPVLHHSGTIEGSILPHTRTIEATGPTASYSHLAKGGPDPQPSSTESLPWFACLRCAAPGKPCRIACYPGTALEFTTMSFHWATTRHDTR